MHKEVKVTFEPSGRAVYALPGTVLLEAAARAGLILETPCGGAGKCGKCLVRVAAGHCPPTPEEKSRLGERRLAEGYRLACEARILSALTIEIPETSLFQSQAKILTTDTGGAVEVRPGIRTQVLALTPPDRSESSAPSDLELLRAGLGSSPAADPTPMRATLHALRRLPGALRAAGFRVTAVRAGPDLIDVTPGDTANQCHGLAFDIGTTTLVGTLVDLRTGADLGIAARINPQTSFGDDVVSRIQKCRTDKDGLAQLQSAVLGAVNKLIEELTHKAKIDPATVYEAVFSGNTTMQQLLCGIDPSALGELPFLPATRGPVTGRAADLHLKIHPEARFHVFPVIGGFVGGDTVAGIVATRLDGYTDPALLVDIGTNGEIVLAANGRMLATSVAAGPAFEGARIVNGMRGAHGAIEKVLFQEDVAWNVIGHAKPAGICGTGLIDAAAEMLRHGILDVTGRVLGPDEVPAALPPSLRARLTPHGDEVDFLLVRPEESATGQPLYLYQRDIRELQLANGAIRAGINILLRTAGIAPLDLRHVLLAGAFGNFIRRRNARRIGMLPAIPCTRILFVGNTASFGAKRALLSEGEKEYADRIVATVRHVDLSLDPEFQMEFSSAMLLPDDSVDAHGDSGE